MTKSDKQIELRDKIVKGLEQVYEKLLIFKKDKKSELVIMQGKKIVKIKPEQNIISHPLSNRMIAAACGFETQFF